LLPSSETKDAHFHEKTSNFAAHRLPQPPNELSNCQVSTAGPRKVLSLEHVLAQSLLQPLQAAGNGDIAPPSKKVTGNKRRMGTNIEDCSTRNAIGHISRTSAVRMELAFPFFQLTLLKHVIGCQSESDPSSQVGKDQSHQNTNAHQPHAV
jgi:hypothetical protein